MPLFAASNGCKRQGPETLSKPSLKVIHRPGALYLASFSKVRESISLDGLIPEAGPRTALTRWLAL